MKRITILGILAFAVVFVAPAVVMSGPPGPVDSPPPAGWDVNILNQPIEVTGDVTGTVTGDVEITNDETNPVAVEVIAKPVKERVQIHDVQLIQHGDDGFGAFGFGKPIFTVPEGKRLIVETVSVGVRNEGVVNYTVNIHTSGVPAFLRFLLTTKGTFPAGAAPSVGYNATTVAATLIVPSGQNLLYQGIRDESTHPNPNEHGGVDVG